MSNPEIALRQFGETSGFEGLVFDERGAMLLQTESGRQMGVERGAGSVMVHVSQPLGYDAGLWMLRAWKRSHHTRQEDWPVQAALREREGEQRLVALTRIADSDFTAQRLQQAFEHLSRWLDAVRDDTY